MLISWYTTRARSLGRALLWLAAAGALVHLSSAGQQPQQPSTATVAPQRTTLRVTTRLVQINIVAEDKKGEPIAGLTKDDFTLLDRGQEQTIALFSQEGGALRASPKTQLPSNLFTNRFDLKTGTPGSISIILFDALNTELKDQSYAREQVIKFLKQLQPQDHVAIYALTNQLRVLHEFTQDASSLLLALQHYSGHSSAALDASNAEPLDAVPIQSASGDVVPGQDPSGTERIEELLEKAFGQISDLAAINRAQTTTQAFEAIANHVARIPGRKSLIWVSGSFPIAIGLDADTLFDPSREHRVFGPELERAARAMNQADLAIYPVDARGLMTLPQYGVQSRGRFNSRLGYRPSINNDNFATMDTLAARTCGRAFYNTNDVYGAVRRAISDGQLTYSIGYYPNHGTWDGKFHEIKIRVNRPGVQLRYRKGYFAAPDPPASAEERKASLEAATWSPIESTSLGVTVEVQPMKGAASPSVELNISVDPHEILFETREGRHVAALDILMLQRDSNSGIAAAEDKHITMNLEEPRYQAVLQEGLIVVRHLPIVDSAVSLRVVVRDSTSGATGSVNIPRKNFLPAATGESARPASSKN